MHAQNPVLSSNATATAVSSHPSDKIPNHSFSIQKDISISDQAGSCYIVKFSQLQLSSFKILLERLHAHLIHQRAVVETPCDVPLMPALNPQPPIIIHRCTVSR